MPYLQAGLGITHGLRVRMLRQSSVRTHQRNKPVPNPTGDAATGACADRREQAAEGRVRGKGTVHPEGHHLAARCRSIFLPRPRQRLTNLSMIKIHWRICATCGLPKAISEFLSSPSCHKCHDRPTNNSKRANPSLPQGSVLPTTQGREAREDETPHAGTRPA